MINKNTTARGVQAAAKDVDRIFYFVSPEGLMLKKEKMEEIAAIFAKALELKLYGMRCGPDVQNPKTLLEELEGIDLERFEVLYFSKEDEESSVLSHDQKVQFVAELGVNSINTGLIAKRLIDGTESIPVP